MLVTYGVEKYYVHCLGSRYLYICYNSLGSYGSGMCFVRAEQLGNKDPKKRMSLFYLTLSSVHNVIIILILWRRDGGDGKTRPSIKYPIPWWDRFRFIIGSRHRSFHSEKPMEILSSSQDFIRYYIWLCQHYTIIFYIYI